MNNFRQVLDKYRTFGQVFEALVLFLDKNQINKKNMFGTWSNNVANDLKIKLNR